MFLRHSRICAIGMMIFGSSSFATVSSVLIGGVDYTGQKPAYAAYMTPNGNLTRLSGSGLPFANGQIYGVALNDSGIGLIGGGPAALPSPAYVAFVTPNASLIQLSGGELPVVRGIIYGVAINSSKAGIIGGHNFVSGAAYAALVAPDGTLSPLSGAGLLPSAGYIDDVAINDSGIGLIGGRDTSLTRSYAALVMPNHDLHPLSGTDFPSNSGSIQCVAINQAGVGIIGGREGLHTAYAALVTPDGNLQKLSGSEFPAAQGIIADAAINDSGVGIIGGSDSTGIFQPYAAFVAPNGSLHRLVGAGLPSKGSIRCVSINNAGAAIIGGVDNTSSSQAYAALVAPDGSLIRLSGEGFPVHEGSIQSVAIDDSGVGIIGGRDNISFYGPAYAALVAPNGTLTRLTGEGFPSVHGSIDSVAIHGIAPRAVGPYGSAIYSQLAAISAMQSHLMIRSQMNNLHQRNADVAANDLSEETSMKYAVSPKCPDRTVWIEPFGDYLHLRTSHHIPSFTNTIGGVLMGYDHRISSSLMCGAAIGYAYNYIDYLKHRGRGNVQEGLGCVDVAYQKTHLRVNGALWGGFYRFFNHRRTLGFIASTTHTHGWILSPQLEVAFPYSIHENNAWSQSVEPFAHCSYVNSWQKHYTETGGAGLNLVMDGHYAALVQSEAGLRFYEKCEKKQGVWLFEQKLSYINQAPIHFDHVTTFFVQSASTFPVATGNSKIQNLGGIELCGSFQPKNRIYPYVGLDLQASLSPSYQSYFLSIQIGKSF